MGALLTVLVAASQLRGVKSHLRRIFHGLEVRTRAVAVSKAAELRLPERQSARVGAAVPGIR
ncbi:hypothetical protein [Streptomyces sp. cg40]|uniref:hypothetical protein n=1 Tax=Streptomyces sp. cg40 TaxID=3419764 RepID=UPI003D0500B7